MKIASPFPNRHRPRIAIVPLIDIMFFLLAAFALLSTNRSAGAPRPRGMEIAAEASLPKEGAEVTLTVTEGRTILWSGEKISSRELRRRLVELVGDDPGSTVSVRGEDRASFGDVLEVLSIVRYSGVRNVALQQPE